jgi:Zn-dependent M28 family amino/carboxypeptidase
VVQTSWGGEDFELPSTGEPRVRVKMWVTEDAGRRIVRMGGRDLDELRRRAERRDFQPVPLGVHLSLELKTTVRRVTTANVLGKLPGSDAKLAKQAVIYSAHHDHLGVGKAKDGDAIYNGALDNASGVAGMLAIADGMVRAQPRPKRSVWFAAVGVEESGLLGSEYFCKHPTVPPGSIAANINLDGINIWGRTSDISYIGFGKSSLDELVVRAATEQGRKVKPDQFPDKGYFYRSDQFNFARVGVPAIYLDEGTEFVGQAPGWGRAKKEEYEQKRYHQPSDQIDSGWVFDGAVEDQRLLAVVGLRIADAPSLPSWKPGDEFEAARKRALGAR